jgi:putative SOS response-associated peptidase YedK
MCGRFAVTTDPVLLAERLGALDETGGALSAPNYNVAPSTDIAAVVARHDEPDDQARRRLRAMRWGLLPPWALDPTKAGARAAHPLINARAETLTTSPAFRTAAKHRRCLIPMDGYYEWQPNPDNPKRGRKTPFYFYRPDGAPLFVAGVWAAGKQDGPSCTIVTTEATGEFAAVHHRMPLVLGETAWDRWLDPDAEAPAALLAGPPEIGPMTMREVATLVNKVANNGPELIESPGPGNQPIGLF